MYKANEKIEEREDLSVGEDLETFIRKIKNGEINKEKWRNEQGIWVNMLFLICLLDTKERKKLDQKDEAFMETFLGSPDIPEAEWNESESNLKFELSYCWRRTYFIDL